ncbi:hypothetical protein [Labilibaculum sp.]|uniref:hypothetical protein n=1 Tax=Labilibaculum sp. TaxID=2060723 RepID=UPI002AA738BA|nr:hypothetical protein [Labilibaculum sp.]
MQKLDFSINIGHVISELCSEQIVAIFDQGFKLPGTTFNYTSITPILFASKSKYDNLVKTEEYASILNKINASEVYEEANLAFLTTQLRNMPGRDLIINDKVSRLYSFHKSLVDLKKITTELLVDKKFSGDLDSLMDTGYLIFQIAIEEDGLEPSQYLKIITALDELIKTIEKINGQSDEDKNSARIIMLDSGSDTNLGIKSQVETAKSLFLIFKEIWDFITNHRFYKTKQQNEAFMESLTIRQKIVEMQKNGVLTEDEAKEYSFMIKTRTDTLIGLKVLPKSIMNTNHLVENKYMLKEYRGLKLLES